MYKAVTYVKEHYGNPTVILSENGIKMRNELFYWSFNYTEIIISNSLKMPWISAGMDDPGNVTLRVGLHDTTRLNYYRSYITELKKAIDDGANVIGYFAWSLLDNFEWQSGYTSRFGLVYIDYKNLRRYPKMSAYWFRQWLNKNWTTSGATMNCLCFYPLVVVLVGWFVSFA